MKKIWTLLNGPQTIGTSKVFWILFIVVLIFFILYPRHASRFQVMNASNFLLNIPMALGLSLLWGYGGTLSFGQVAFFGIGGYTYGIIAGNLIGHSLGGLYGFLGGIIFASFIAFIFGYFVFYGKVSGWIVPILTLVLTLTLNTFMNQTAGYQWRVGEILLGGYNGMVGIPSFWIGDTHFFGASFYYLVLAIIVLLYFFLRLFLNSYWGHVIIGIREDELRTEFLGHNTRLINLVVFIISAAFASISGIFYVQWGNFIAPDSMGLLTATLPVIWVVVGGRSTLLGVMLATLFLNIMDYRLAAQGSQYAFIIMGFILVLVIMYMPKGLLTLFELFNFKKRAS